MDIRAIRTDNDYEWALGEIEAYFKNEPAPGSEDADRFDILADLVAAYEERRFPMPALDPVALVKAAMEDRGLSQKDLAQLLGSRSRASEILTRKRALSLDMIRLISRAWNIPADALVRPYDLAA